MAKITINIPEPEKIFNENIFKNLYDYSNHTEIHYGGASSGKSHGVTQKVILKTLLNKGHPRKVLWTRKVGATIGDSIYAEVKAGLNDFGILKHCGVSKSNYKIQLPNGGEFIFKGLDDPEKIKSIKDISDVVMEEASEFNLDDYTQLTLRLRNNKYKDRQMYLMFNPVSKTNWTYKAFFIKNPRGVVYYHSTYKDNRFLDKASIEIIERLAETNPNYYKIYTLGEFTTTDKLVFPTYKKEIINKDKIKHLKSLFGLDFGYVNDPSAFIHIKVDEQKKKLYVLQEYVKKGMLNNEIATAITNLGYRKEKIKADSSEQKSIAEIRKQDIPNIVGVKKWGDSIIHGISYMLQYEIIVDYNCTNTIEELENYTWTKDKATNEYTNQPKDTNNHCIDSIRYAMSDLIYKNRGKKPIDNLKMIRQFGL